MVYPFNSNAPITKHSTANQLPSNINKKPVIIANAPPELQIIMPIATPETQIVMPIALMIASNIFIIVVRVNLDQLWLVHKYERLPDK